MGFSGALEEMGIAVGSEDEMEDMPISNPLPPPPRPQGKDRRDRDRSKEEAADRAENLSNADFRKMVMDTPRRGEEKQKERPRRYAYLISPPVVDTALGHIFYMERGLGERCPRYEIILYLLSLVMVNVD